MLDDFEEETTDYFKDVKPERFKLIPWQEFALRPLPQWIIKGILAQSDLAVIYGEPGCGKSFMALDMAMTIARGKEWQNNRVKQERVVYICAEGEGGFSKRLLAYQMHHKIVTEEIPLQVIAEAPDFLHVGDARLIAEKIGKCGVVFIDTFSRTMPGGNENSAEHVGYAIAQCKIISDQTGALVVLVHHSGKDTEKGARGWSGLKGAVDTEIEVTRIGDARKGRISKQKDGEDGAEWGFELHRLIIGTDDDGDEITSCVYLPVNFVPLEESRTKDHGSNEKRIIKAMKEIGGVYLSADDVVEHAKKSMMFDKHGRDTRRQVLMRAIDSLEENGFIANVNGIINLI